MDRVPERLLTVLLRQDGDIFKAAVTTLTSKTDMLRFLTEIKEQFLDEIRKDFATVTGADSREAIEHSVEKVKKTLARPDLQVKGRSLWEVAIKQFEAPPKFGPKKD